MIKVHCQWYLLICQLCHLIIRNILMRMAWMCPCVGLCNPQHRKQSSWKSDCLIRGGETDTTCKNNLYQQNPFCPGYAFYASVCSCKCPLIPQGIYLLTQARASRETIMFRPSMNDRLFSIVLSAAQERAMAMFLQAFPCTQSLGRSATRRENACLPRSQRAR